MEDHIKTKDKIISKIKEYENSTKDKNPYSACNVNTSINFKIDFLSASSVVLNIVDFMSMIDLK